MTEVEDPLPWVPLAVAEATEADAVNCEKEGSVTPALEQSCAA
jgi:hypothetical protein